MQYRSTRGLSPEIDSAQAVLNGLAADGGLYLPAEMPTFDWISCIRKDTQAMAQQLLSAFLPDIPDMGTLVKRAYTGKFETEALTPTVPAGDFYVLELFRGPTSAFKDVALSMLPQLMTAAKAVKGEKKDILILTATSGDTGKAALEGFKDTEGIRICVFYPYGGVSDVQRRQMVSQEGSNVTVCAVRGNFDDAQTGVKNIFNACRDMELTSLLKFASFPQPTRPTWSKRTTLPSNLPKMPSKLPNKANATPARRKKKPTPCPQPTHHSPRPKRTERPPRVRVFAMATNCALATTLPHNCKPKSAFLPPRGGFLIAICQNTPPARFCQCVEICPQNTKIAPRGATFPHRRKTNCHGCKQFPTTVNQNVGHGCLPQATIYKTTKTAPRGGILQNKR